MKFCKSDVGKWVLFMKSIDGTTVYLADRHKTKSQWWTTDVNKIMKFYKKSAAEYQRNRYHKVSLLPITSKMI